jgi:hypothetical protein
LVLSVVWFGEDVTPRLTLASALLLGGVGLTVCEPLLARWSGMRACVVGGE